MTNHYKNAYVEACEYVNSKWIPSLIEKLYKDLAIYGSSVIKIEFEPDKPKTHLPDFL